MINEGLWGWVGSMMKACQIETLYQGMTEAHCFSYFTLEMMPQLTRMISHFTAALHKLGNS